MRNRYKIKGKVIETSHVNKNKANSNQQSIIVAVNSVKRIKLQLFDILIQVLESMDHNAEMTFTYYEMDTFHNDKHIIYRNVVEITQIGFGVKPFVRPDLYK